jgi:transcriptional regulator with XRE-family HTH domain
MQKADIEKFYQDVEQLELRFPVAEIAIETGFSKSNVSKYLKKARMPSGNFIATFYKVYGNKLSQEKHNEATDLGAAKATYVNKAGNDFIELSGGKYIMNTPLITKKAYAGYLAGWGDDEYINELPKHPIVVDKPHLGYYHSFEVSGDSMDDGTARAIQNGDIVTGRKIDRQFWKSKLHLSKFRDFVIVSLEGIVCKEIIKHDTAAGVLTCHSLNPDKENYPDFEIELAKVIQIFNIVQVTKKR